MSELSKISYLFAPLFLGLTFHGLCIKFHWLKSLARPIDGEKKFRGKQFFGNNKTYRGLVAVGLGTAVGFGVQAFALHNISALRNLELFEYKGTKVILLGFAMGVAAMLSELPNSFLKRQLQIAPGAAGNGVQGLFFYILDQIDLLFGAWLVLSMVVAVTAERVFWSMLFLFVGHQLITIIGYWLGMRSTPR